MQSNILLLEKKLKLKKIDAHADELAIQKLKLLEKAGKLDGEIDIANNTIEDLKKEIAELEAQGE